MTEPPQDTPEATAESHRLVAESPWLPPELRPAGSSRAPDTAPGAGSASSAAPAAAAPPEPEAVPARRPSPARRPRAIGGALKWIAGALVTLALVVLAVLAVLLFVRGDLTDGDKPQPSPVTNFRPLNTPFTVSGARFEVQSASSAKWAARIRRRTPRAGRRWVTVGVRLRNLSGRHLRPRGLGYRILTPDGLVVGPEALEALRGTLDAKERLGKGELTSIQLGFQVADTQRDLTLAVDAGGIAQPSIRVRLGAAM